MMRPSSPKASSSSLRLALRFCMGALPSFCKKSASRPIPVKEAWVMQTGKVGFGFQGTQPAAGQGGFTDTVFATQKHQATQGRTLVEQRRGALDGRGGKQFAFGF